MKKFLLILGLGAMALQANAQGGARWDVLNTDPNASPFLADFAIDRVHTVNPNLMWSTGYDDGGTTNTYVIYDGTATVAANRIIQGQVVSPSGQSNLEAANIQGITKDIAVAAMFPSSGTGGEILRTTNGSGGAAVWTKRTTAAQYSSADSFLDFVHMFNATDGVAVGDPIVVGGTATYEVVRTTDGGITWTSSGITAPTRAITGEAAFVRAYYGNATDIWFIVGTQSANNGVTPGTGARVFRSSDKGLTWTVGALPASFVGVPSEIAFRDSRNGICIGLSVSAAAPNPGTPTTPAGNRISSVNMASTSDGGATWTSITPNRGIATPGNRLYLTGLDVARTSATQSVYISYGLSKIGTDSTGTGMGRNFLSDYGYSYSIDGINWTGVQRKLPMITMDVLDTPGIIDATTGHGFAGYFTSSIDGTGGLYKTKFSATQNLVKGALDARNSKQSVLNVYPNPSNSGVFQLALDGAVQAGTHLTVTDLLGRAVYSRELNATTVSAKSVSIDLSSEKAGVYLLSLRSESGVASQKLVIE